MSLPPILSTLNEKLEKYLTDPSGLPIHDTEPATRFWERIPNPKRELQVTHGPLSTTIQVERDLKTGDVTGYKEIDIGDMAGANAKNSTSMRRAPGPKGESARGNAMNFMFWPGGFQDDFPDLAEDIDDTEILKELDNPSNYLTCAPNLPEGISFIPNENSVFAPKNSEVLNLADILTTTSISDDLASIWSTEDIKDTNDEPKTSVEENVDKDHEEVVDDLEDQLQIQKKITEEGDTLWAEIVDISQPMLDFHNKVPNMAYTWPFELDTFQKQAVWHLECNDSVFVAAHTSAGKTVVAEYAIALSKKHMTRTIYTSPIKALSNQKFRDFKDTFEDVGLVTGDIQINPSATCLIMTTEILRSMLYNGSDIIRDLEYVIFDEVHYINDRDRGVVWEEVIILLPDHVNIIMLSATVPNTLEFADWVGRTKKRKIYVISTLKRPVPLEHFLYTGSDGKSKDEIFLLQDASGKFLQEGHRKAELAKKARESKNKQGFGGTKGTTKDRVNPQQERNIWLTLVDHLKRKDKLPVVAFTLSRNRCDNNATMLTSLDLTTSMEKSDIHHFIAKCVLRLKSQDRQLPQVMQLTEMLKRGIGVHHSGVLPLLKEVVEMLFARGFVKLLFATETFAMGVNMPARTVVFDSIRKHDGKEFRTLLPAEYIQMAGRAGRRGLDTTGTVIILCKNEVHAISELHKMMQGKPMKLVSEFRLTYSMILNLLRVERLRVEDMMMRSFSEVDRHRKEKSHKSRMEELKKKKANLSILRAGGQTAELQRFFELATDYLKLKEHNWNLLLNQQGPSKSLTPGRILLVNLKDDVNVPCILLSVEVASKAEKAFTVLILKASVDLKSENRSIEDYLSLGLRCNPDSQESFASSEHCMVTLKASALAEITKTCHKIDKDKVINDIQRRQIPRFADAPIGQSTLECIEKLQKYSADLQQKLQTDLCSWIKDFKIQDMTLLTDLQQMALIMAEIQEIGSLKIVDFKTSFAAVYDRQVIEEELKMIEWALGEDSLTNMEDYHHMVKVLQELKYIDNNRTVQLKGRVACEMGSHSLLVTELVFDNVLTDRPPAEIAALLSCLVFEQRNCSAPELTKSLETGIEAIKKCALTIGQMQKACGMKASEQEFVDQFNFGLVQVAYEWARGKPFGEIVGLSDVQEGIVVRSIQRLDEALRDVKDAARVIGDPMLYQKMDEASSIIKRDIVFAASLYTQ